MEEWLQKQKCQKYLDIYAVIRVLKIDLFIDVSRLQYPSSNSTLYYKHGVGKQLSVSLDHSFPPVHCVAASRFLDNVL